MHLTNRGKHGPSDVSPFHPTAATNKGSCSDAVSQLSHTIAGLLETDRDVCNYIAVCRQTYGAVGNEQSHIWRKRFKQQYDLLPNKPTGEVARKYKVRQRVLRTGAIFSFGHEFKERVCLDIIRELITGRYFTYVHPDMSC